MRKFAESEIIIPDGVFEGRRFKVDRQPYTGLWFDAVDSGQWNRIVSLGPTQSGKTLLAFVIVMLYHLFEIGEKIIVGLPDLDMASDKWVEDILPVIERSQYAKFLPRSGAGSRGGKVKTVRFRNGVTLKFMSGASRDKARAGYTARVLCITETDGLEKSSGTSVEADKIKQMEARTRAWAQKKRIYMECTVSVEEGRTWREYKGGTNSRIFLRCPHCKKWVSPERKHLIGWKGANSEHEARDKAVFACPECGKAWTEAHRTQANMGARLVHEGQRITRSGSVLGTAKQTSTLGFRWSGVNNLFVKASDIGIDEWRAENVDEDEENAEKEMQQFVWAVPYKPPKFDFTPLNPVELTKRQSALVKGVVPETTVYLTAAVDVGKWMCHFVVIAWTARGAHVVDYGCIDVATASIGVERGVLQALRQFRDVCLGGWGLISGGTRVPDQVFIDSGYQPDSVYEFCRESMEGEAFRFRPTKGYGWTQDRFKKYTAPKKTNKAVPFIGSDYHVVRVMDKGVELVHVNADAWKTFVHQRLSTPADEDGSMTLYVAERREHRAFCNHLTAEKQVQEFVIDKGTVMRWIAKRPQNHWFDATYNACAAAHLCGFRIVKPKIEKTAEQVLKPRGMVAALTTPDGRPFVATR